MQYSSAEKYQWGYQKEQEAATPKATSCLKVENKQTQPQMPYLWIPVQTLFFRHANCLVVNMKCERALPFIKMIVGKTDKFSQREINPACPPTFDPPPLIL